MDESNNEFKRIKRTLALISGLILVQAITIACLSFRIDSLTGVITILNRNFLDFQKQINVSIEQTFNEFVLFGQ